MGVLAASPALAENTSCAQVVGDFAGEAGATLAVCSQEFQDFTSPAIANLQLVLLTAEGTVAGVWTHDAAVTSPESGFESGRLAAPEITLLDLPDGDDGVLIELTSDFDYYNLHGVGECEHTFGYRNVLGLQFRDSSLTSLVSISLEDGSTRTGCCSDFIEWRDFVDDRPDCYGLVTDDEREAANCDVSCEYVDFPEAHQQHEAIVVTPDEFGSPVIWQVGPFEQTPYVLQDGLFVAGEAEIACPEDSSFQVSGFVQRCLDEDGESHGPTLEAFASGGWKDWSRFEHGSPAGMRHRWFENGNRRLVGGYNSAGQAHGVWRAYHEDGIARKVEFFVNGERHGPAWFVEDGVRHDGFYREGERDGVWTADSPEGSEAAATTTCYDHGTEVDCTE